MIEKYYLAKTFGKAGSIFGLIILLAGVFVCVYSWTGITTIFVGAYLAFSHTVTQIDVQNKRLRYTSKLFGIINVGYWHEFKKGMYFKIDEPDNANLSSDGKVHKSEFKIFLYDEKDTLIMPICKANYKHEIEECLIRIEKIFI